MINNILINFPTNLGDVVLGLPTLDLIKANYPSAKITAIASPQTNTFLSRNNFIDSIIIFDKAWPMRKKINFTLSLRRKFEMIVDLKNSFLPVIISPAYRTPFLRKFPQNMHIKDRYISLVSRFTKKTGTNSDINLTDKELSKWKELKLQPSLFIACSSRAGLKQYPYELLKETIDILRGKYPIVILGSEVDRKLYKDILDLEGIVDLVGKTAIFEVFYLIKAYGRVVLAVDSSILHIASYLNIPTIGLFGPTDPGRSHPYSDKSIVLQNVGLKCVPCDKPNCELTHKCMDIDPESIVKAVKRLW